MTANELYRAGRQPVDSRTAVINAARQREAQAKRAAPIERTSAAKIAALEAIRDGAPGLASETQEKRLLEALASWPVTTFEAMRYLDVYHVPARVMGLRARGHSIATIWVKTPTEAGELHRVGQYVLTRGAGAV